MGRIKEELLSRIPKTEIEIRLQRVTDEKIQQEIENPRRKALSNNRCIKCNKPLSRTEFRDGEGELEGWIVECVYCDMVYDED